MYSILDKVNAMDGTGASKKLDCNPLSLLDLPPYVSKVVSSSFCSQWTAYASTVQNTKCRPIRALFPPHIL